MSYIVGLGEIMLRLSSIDNERLLQTPMLNAHFGGCEANVCVSASRFGIKTKYVSVLPDNALGKKVEELLLSQKVDTSCIFWGGKRLGLYFLDMGKDNRQSSVIYDREYSAISEASYYLFDWDNIFKDAKYLHITGITAGISENGRLITLYAVKEAKKRNIKISFDINYRSKLWKYGKNVSDVIPEIVEYVDILFANEYDAINILNIESDIEYNNINTDEEYTNLMQKVIKKYNIETIVTTKRKVVNSSHNIYSAKLIHNNKLYKSKEYNITNIVDRVGSGDAFVAGILSGFYLFENDIQDVLNFAVSAATIKHSIYGDWNLVTKEEVINLMNSSISKDVSR